MTIQEILNTKGTEVLTVPDSTTLAVAATRLAVNNIGALVVTDQAGQALGLFTESDLTRTVAELGSQALDLSVSHAASRDIAVVEANASIPAVMDIMTRFRTRYVVVFDDDLTVGIVSIGDVVKARLDDCQLEASVLRDHYLVHH